MTIEARIPNKTYEGNGATKIWPLPFPAIEEKFVQVYVSREDGGSDLVDPSKYQVDLELKQVIYPLAGDPVASGKKLTLLRSTPIDQDLELLTNGNFFPEDIEGALDKRTMIEQEILEILRRAVKVPVWAEDPEEFGQGVLEARDRAETAAREAKKSEDLALGYASGAEASKNAAEASGGQAATHAEAASHSALNANDSANKAKQISEGVEIFVGQASSSAAEAQTAKNAAEASAQEAKSQANNSNTSAIEAGQYAEAGEIAKNAAEFAQGNSESAAEKAKTSETNAKNSETNSKTSETDAGLYAQLAEAAKNEAVTKAEEAALSSGLAASEAEKAEITATRATAAAGQADTAKTQAIAAAGQADTAKTEAVAARDQAEDAKNRSVEIKEEIEAALDGMETAGVVSVNGKSGMVTLTAEDVDAAPAVHTHIFPVTSVNGQTGDVVIATGGGGTGAGVSSVNGKSGEVRLDYYEVGASAAVHNHEVGNIVGINDLLSQKAPNAHTHEISQVNNLESRLASKTDNGHTHELIDVDGLKPQLDEMYTGLYGKADTLHTHTASDISDLEGLKTAGIKITGGVAGSSQGVSTTNDTKYGVTVGDYTAIGHDAQIAIGMNAVTKETAQDHAIAIGQSSLANNGGSIAFGSNAKATNTYAQAIGEYAEAQGKSSMATGLAAIASGDESEAYGQAAKATHSYSGAYGKGSVSYKEFAVSVGSNTTKRNIGYVAPAVLDHEVVTYGQMKNYAKPWIVNTVIHPVPAGMFNPILASSDPINASILHPDNADIQITAVAQDLYSQMALTYIPLSSLFAVVANGDFSIVVPVPYYVEYSLMDNTWTILIANSEAFFVADLGTNQAGVSKMIDPSSLQFQIKVRAL